MKYLIAAIILLSILSCRDTGTDNIIAKEKSLAYRLNIENKNYSDVPDEIITGDHEVFRLLLNPENTWEDIDRWYHQVMPKYQDEAYYKNLKSITMSSMVQSPNFQDEVSLGKAIYYADQLMGLDNVGLLKSSYILCQILDKKGKPDLAKRYAQEKLDFIKKSSFRSAEKKDQFLKKHKKEIDKLEYLAYQHNSEKKLFKRQKFVAKNFEG